MIDFQAGPMVLDGGLSTALEQQGADLGGALWTARLLGAEPERIAAAHRAFFDAGRAGGDHRELPGQRRGPGRGRVRRRRGPPADHPQRGDRPRGGRRVPGVAGGRVRRPVRRVPRRRLRVHRPVRRARHPAARLPRAAPGAAGRGRSRPARRRDDPGRRRGRGARRSSSTSSTCPRGSATRSRATAPRPVSCSSRRTRCWPGAARSSPPASTAPTRPTCSVPSGPPWP